MYIKPCQHDITALWHQISWRIYWDVRQFASVSQCAQSIQGTHCPYCVHCLQCAHCAQCIQWVEYLHSLRAFCFFFAILYKMYTIVHILSIVHVVVVVLCQLQIHVTKLVCAVILHNYTHFYQTIMYFCIRWRRLISIGWDWTNLWAKQDMRIGCW